MISVSDRCRASIRSVGISSPWLWVISKLGQTVDREMVGDLAVKYVMWRGQVYTIVKRVRKPNDLKEQSDD